MTCFTTKCLVRADEARRIPLGRRGLPDDVARWIVALADPSADWITGQVITVDGGLEGLNRPLERGLARLARALYGTAGRAEIQRVLLTVFDIPYGAARRHLIAGKPLPVSVRPDVDKAVRAVLAR